MAGSQKNEVIFSTFHPHSTPIKDSVSNSTHPFPLAKDNESPLTHPFPLTKGNGSSLTHPFPLAKESWNSTTHSFIERSSIHHFPQSTKRNNFSISNEKLFDSCTASTNLNEHAFSSLNAPNAPISISDKFPSFPLNIIPNNVSLLPNMRPKPVMRANSAHTLLTSTSRQDNDESDYGTFGHGSVTMSKPKLKSNQKSKTYLNLINQLGGPPFKVLAEVPVKQKLSEPVDTSQNFQNTSDKESIKDAKVTFNLPPRHMNIPPDSSSENDNVSDNLKIESDEGVDPATTVIVRCRNPLCDQTTEKEEASATFKECHNCHAFYCSRSCRRAHWERHKKNCAKIRASSAARQVVTIINDQAQHLETMSAAARRGVLARGRGVVKVYFDHAEAAESFVSGGAAPSAHYVTRENIMPNEMGADMYRQITDYCKHYNPESKFILYVNICVVNEIPTEQSPRGRREMVSRCCKLKLSDSKNLQNCGLKALPKKEHIITRDMNESENIILTSLSTSKHNFETRNRIYNNILVHLRNRGVQLPDQYRDIHNKLLSYKDGSDHFPPTTIYPIDTTTNASFMCVLMPETDWTVLQNLKADSNKVPVRIINVATS